MALGAVCDIQQQWGQGSVACFPDQSVLGLYPQRRGKHPHICQKRDPSVPFVSLQMSIVSCVVSQIGQAHGPPSSILRQQQGYQNNIEFISPSPGQEERSLLM